MKKSELIAALSAIDEDCEIMFQVDEDLFTGQFSWVAGEHARVDGVKNIYRQDEQLYDDKDDFYDAVANDYCGEGGDEEIQKLVDAAPVMRRTIISVGP